MVNTVERGLIDHLAIIRHFIHHPVSIVGYPVMETLRTCYERGMNCISNCVPNISWGKMSQNSPTQNFSPQKNRNHRGCTWRQNSPPRFFHDIFVGWFSQHLSTSVSHFSILLAFCFPKKAAETRCFPKLFAPLR